jgi:hypothetical protein
MHHYFVTNGDTIDVQAMRDEAQRRAVDKRAPECSTIHHHPHGTPCTKHPHEHVEKEQE